MFKSACLDALIFMKGVKVMNKFELGKVLTTKGVFELMQKDEMFFLFVNDSLDKYSRCDWGDTCEDDCKINDNAVENGNERIHASYKDSDGMKIWIITEWDRSVTTILFPGEY